MEERRVLSEEMKGWQLCRKEQDTGKGTQGESAEKIPDQSTDSTGWGTPSQLQQPRLPDPQERAGWDS